MSALPRAIAALLAATLAACGYDGGTRANGDGEEMAIYIVAVKRERRTEISPDWVETLRATPGVEVTGAGDGPIERRRVRVRATADGVDALRERVGAFCHVEPLLEHRHGDS